MKQLIICILLCLTGRQAAVAQSVKIGGVVTDEEGAPIELATVRLEGTLTGTASDLKGRYSLKFERRDSVTVVFSMLGYQTRRRTLVRPQGNIRLDITLPSLHFELGEVSVTERRRQTGSMQQIDAASGKLMTDASGSRIEALIGTQAGVSNNNELSAQYNVRGGSFDENLVYVNGIEIYRPLLIRSAEQEGLSFVNPDMVQSIAFSTGGYEAKYGDRMSSVLDITYRKPERTEATASVSLLGASVYAGLATRDKRLTWTHALRYQTNRYLLGTLDTRGEYNPGYTDYQTYLSWSPSRRWELSLIGNLARNSYDFQPADRYTRFGTIENVRTFKVYFGGREKDLFLTLSGAATATWHLNENTGITLQASAFHTREQETYDITGQYWLSDTEADGAIGVGTYMEHARNYLNADVQSLSLLLRHRLKSHAFQAGAEVRSEQIRDRMSEWELRDSAGYSLPHTPEGPELIYTLRSNNRTESIRTSFYLQDTYRFRSPAGLFTLHAGIRGSYWNWNREFIVSPRASLALIPAFNERFTLRLAAGVYYQAPFYKEFRDTTQVDGAIAVSLNRHIRSPRSLHLVAGGDYNFRLLNRPFRFTAEVYYKALDNLIPYNIDNVRISYYGRNLSRGYAAGVDMKLFGEFVEGTDSWLTFSLMKTEEKLGGKWLPRPTDQRYRLSLYFTDYFPGSRRWTMNLKATLAGGLPFGPPHSGRETALFRTPPYRRVDIGLSHNLIRPNESAATRFGLRNLWLGVDVFNLLNISNVNSYYWVTDAAGSRFAVPNYLTGRKINIRLFSEF
ncbi:MAG: TonB-dependent receptor [Prevotellaceae bacterium]|jgi:hypothetical protein|nr:TonB-dependent receptor [Prevotellaceae bacterium]